jgi:hypothetical protein
MIFLGHPMRQTYHIEGFLLCITAKSGCSFPLDQQQTSSPHRATSALPPNSDPISLTRVALCLKLL